MTEEDTNISLYTLHRERERERCTVHNTYINTSTHTDATIHTHTDIHVNTHTHPGQEVKDLLMFPRYILRLHSIQEVKTETLLGIQVLKLKLCFCT